MLPTLCAVVALLFPHTTAQRPHQGVQADAVRIRFLIEQLGQGSGRGGCVPYTWGVDGRGDVAAAELVRIGKAAVPSLISVVKNAQHLPQDANAQTWRRTFAVEVLGRIGDKRAVTVLIQTLKHDEDDCVQAVIPEALGSLGDLRAQDVLIQGLKNESAWMRWQCAAALGVLRAAKAVPNLIALLGEEEGIGGFHVGPPPVADGAMTALIRIGRPALGRLVESLRSSNAEVHRRAALALCHIYAPRSQQALSLFDREEDMYGHPERPLKGPEARKALRVLSGLLQDSSPDVRTAAEQAMKATKRPQRRSDPF
jgi:HEAT repeat protein